MTAGAEAVVTSLAVEGACFRFKRGTSWDMITANSAIARRQRSRNQHGFE